MASTGEPYDLDFLKKKKRFLKEKKGERGQLHNLRKQGHATWLQKMRLEVPRESNVGLE